MGPAVECGSDFVCERADVGSLAAPHADLQPGEFAFEDHRYWDLLRWGDAMEVLNSPVKGVRIGKNSNGIPQYQEREVAVRVFNERNYYMPFTNAEILKSNGKLEQNNGY